jgi:pyruvate/2-oxoacid:ferredoxin oxidoreductase beta subunit
MAEKILGNNEVLNILEKGKESFRPGHRTCAGCFIPTIVRTILGNVPKGYEPIVAIATGCLEVTSTLWPNTSWGVPTIHNTFENASVTLAGAERAHLVNVKKGLEKPNKKFIAIGGDGGCYSEDTNILTDRGFISVKDMNLKDKYWSVNPKTNNLELVKAEKIHKYKYEGKLIRVKSKFVDFLVTPNHNFPMRLKNNWEFIPAEELLTRYKTPITRKFGWKGKLEKYFTLPKLKQKTSQKQYDKFLTSDWLSFLGWFISEGCLYHSDSGYLIRIYQSNTKNRKEIFNLLQRLGLNPFECSRSVDFQSKQVFEYLRKNCGSGAHEKQIPKEILNLDKSQLIYIFNSLMKGDGSINKQPNRNYAKNTYITVSKKLKDDFVELCLKLGFGCKVNYNKEIGKSLPSVKGKISYIYRIGISKNALNHMLYSKRKLYELQGHKQIFEEKYSGLVYCPQLVKNHIVIIERNGIISANGNSVDIGLAALSGTLERGHDILYVLYTNEVYSNTGSQRSGDSPIYANTSTTPVGKDSLGKEENRKDIMQIIAGHNIPYVAQCNPYYLDDFVYKIKKAMSIKGPKFLNVLMPCTFSWKFETNLTAELAKLATETNVWPLYEIENGKYTLNYSPKKFLGVDEYFKYQGRFKHLFNPVNKLAINNIQKNIDEKFKKIKELSK